MFSLSLSFFNISALCKILLTTCMTLESEKNNRQSYFGKTICQDSLQRACLFCSLSRIWFHHGKPLAHFLKGQENSVRLGSPAFLPGLQVAPSTRLGPAGQLPSPPSAPPPSGQGRYCALREAMGTRGKLALPLSPLPCVPWTIVEAYAPRLRIMVF